MALLFTALLIGGWGLLFLYATALIAWRCQSRIAAILAICAGLVFGLMYEPWKAFRVVESDDPDVHDWVLVFRTVAVLWSLGFCGAIASAFWAFRSLPPLPEGITKMLGVCGGSACIRGKRITVWGLTEWRRLGLSDSEIKQRVHGLTDADLEAAWKYAALHQDEIQEAIRGNAEA